MKNKTSYLKYFLMAAAMTVLLLCLFAGTAAAEDHVYISELLASSAQRNPDKSFDWLEICNPTRSSIDLSGWSICRKNGKSFTFPEGTRLSGKGYMQICFDEEGGAFSNCLNAPLSLKAGGDTLTLKDRDGNAVDEFTYPQQYGNISCGRLSCGGETLYLEKATGGKANECKGYAERSAAPVLSREAGLYPEAVTLTVSGEGTIRYTLDGSEVTKKSKVWEGEKTFSENTALRVRVFEEGKLPSATVSATYIIGETFPCPVVLLVCDQEYLTGSNGLMIAGTGSVKNYDQNWEYPIHMDYVDADGTTLVSQDLGFRIVGELSRRYNQKGMVLTARKAYSGSNEIKFSPFTSLEAGGFTSFKSITLRSAGSEAIYEGIRFRDAFLTSLAEGTHVLYQSSTPVVVMMNGKVYGHYNLREKINRSYIAQHEGITDEDVTDSIDLLVHHGEVVQGSSEEYSDLRAYVRTHDLNDPECLEYVLSRVDIDNMFDHHAFEVICSNEDMNNIKFYKVPGGKWKWILYDLDTAMSRTNTLPLAWLVRDKKENIEHDIDHTVFSALMEVPEMRALFLQRMGEILYTRFTPQFLTARLDEWIEVYTPIMEYQFSSRKLVREYWHDSLKEFRQQLIVGPRYAVDVAKQYLHMSDEEVQLYFGDFLGMYDAFMSGQ